jgi:prolyl-tRNA editing enzyme YbaK/EbsC (Cys-tRNA(Pro) deacylase)
MLEDFLESNDINAQLLAFEEEVARCENVSKLEQRIPSCKSIVFAYTTKKGREYAIVILEGSKKADWNALKQLLHAEKVRMATPEEVKQVTGYEIGAVPPISIFGTKAYIDQGVLEHHWVLCGGGTRFSLLKIQSKDILEHAFEPEIVNVAE